MDFIQTLKSSLAKKSPLYIRIKVVPKSPKNEIIEIMADETYKIRVAAPATDGKANAELLRFLKKSLGASEAMIVSGKTDRIKLVKLTV
jgi:uncharacterized protein (TIGR00251 family)